MGIIWDRRIAHIDRRVKKAAMRRIRGRLLKATVKARRGAPSRNLTAALMFESIFLARGSGGCPDADARRERLRRLEWAKLRSRLLERKRALRAAAHRRAHPRVEDTCIFLWRRRRDWLRDAEQQMRVQSGVDNPPQAPPPVWMIFWNLRCAPPIIREPVVVPLAWRLVQVPGGDLRIVALIDGGACRLTSPVKTIDPVARTAVTESGRVYELGAGPAEDPATIQLLWARACMGMSSRCVDVSSDVWARMNRVPQ